MSFVSVAHCGSSWQCFWKLIEISHVRWSSSKESNYAAKDVVEVARQKLCGSKIFASSDIKHTFAILRQRFGLEICLGHPEVVEHVESG